MAVSSFAPVSLAVRVDRTKIAGEVAVTVSDLPAGVTSTSALLRPGEAEATLTLTAKETAAMGTARVRVDGRFVHAESPLRVDLFGFVDRRVPFPQPGLPNGILATKNGKALVLTQECVLSRYHASAATLDASFGTGGLVQLPLSECRGLRRSPKGTLFVATTSRVRAFTEAEPLQPKLEVPIASPFAIDGDERLYVAESGTVRRLLADGTPDPSFAPATIPHEVLLLTAPIDGGVLAIGQRVLGPPGEDQSTESVVTPIDDSGAIGPTLPISARPVGRWEGQVRPTWVLPLPNGDAVAAVQINFWGEWESYGRVVRIVRLPTRPWSWITGAAIAGFAFGPPTIADDGSFLVVSGSPQHNAPPVTQLLRVDARGVVTARAPITPRDPLGASFWSFEDLVPLPDGKALTVSYPGPELVSVAVGL